VNETTNTALDQRVAFGKEVERIEKLPQMQRWRAIKNLLLKVKPDLVPLDQEFIADVRQQRELNMLKETGASKSGSTRALYSMPQYLYAALHLIDPEFTKLQDDPELSKQTNLKIARTFPEYCLARKI
jgi:hypothetical protein